MAKSRISIVGLGLIGNSIGLGLSQDKRDFEVVGHDKDSDAAGWAKKMKAVDKTDWNLINACDGADLVVLALPVMAIKETLQALAGELKEGCVVIDTASIKVPVQAWADEILPPSVHFVGTDPVVSAEETGGKAARPDLFEKATWAICPSPTTSETAVKMAADLAERLMAKPLFLEAAEHDGMLTAVEHLPAVVSMALLSSAVGQPSWREMRKLAGGQFESSTRLMSEDPAVFRDIALTNPENLARWIDTFIQNMKGWGELILAGDEESLGAAFENALDARNRWLKERSTGYWDEGQPEMPEKRSMFMEMLGMGRLTSRRSKDKE